MGRGRHQRLEPGLDGRARGGLDVEPSQLRLEVVDLRLEGIEGGLEVDALSFFDCLTQAQRHRLGELLGLIRARSGRSDGDEADVRRRDAQPGIRCIRTERQLAARCGLDDQRPCPASCA